MGGRPGKTSWPPFPLEARPPCDAFIAHVSQQISRLRDSRHSHRRHQLPSSAPPAPPASFTNRLFLFLLPSLSASQTYQSRTSEMGGLSPFLVERSAGTSPVPQLRHQGVQCSLAKTCQCSMTATGQLGQHLSLCDNTTGLHCDIMVEVGVTRSPLIVVGCNGSQYILHRQKKEERL